MEGLLNIPYISKTGCTIFWCGPYVWTSRPPKQTEARPKRYLLSQQLPLAQLLLTPRVFGAANHPAAVAVSLPLAH
jgi:hypothetical protein